MFCKNCGKEVNYKSAFCKECGVPMPHRANFGSWFRAHKKGLIISILIITFFIWIYSDSETSDYNYDSSDNFDYSTENTSPTPSYTQDEIAASVVNILCPGIEDDFSDATGGSGTIITSDGVILTNSHIIPQDSDGNPLTDTCLVILPNPQTGKPEEMYYGTPVIVPILSSEYDIAAVTIDEPYVDDEGIIYGSYSKVFPAFDDTYRCVDENIKLGEPIRIFGYPAISGGYSLTITDGIVSSFPGEGLIITSAKISYGNSGGLAVDRYGCMIGIPSMISGDEYESLGVIISSSLVYEFVDRVDALLRLLQ